MELLRSHHMNMPKTDLINPEKSSYSLIWYENRILIIYTEDADAEALRNSALTFIEKWNEYRKHLQIGFSEAKDGLELLGEAITESFCANISCRIDKEDQLEFRQIGLDQWLIPLRNNPWIDSQYQRFRSILTLYDEEHNTNLYETLYQYMKCSGDVILTANTLYQHANTIRYRLAKIKTLLDISDSMDSYCQLYSFIRLSEIHQLLGEK